VWLMQPEAQTATRGILAVSAPGALEVLLQYIKRFRSGHILSLNFLHNNSGFESRTDQNKRTQNKRYASRGGL